MGGEGDDAPDAHPAVAKFRYRLEWKADQVADPYSSKCVEGVFSELVSEGVRRYVQGG